MFQRNNVIPDLAKIFRAAIYDGTCLSSQQLAQGGLSSFNLARQDRLSPDEGADEDVGIRQSSTFTGQPSYQTIRVGERPDEPWRPLKGGRKGGPG
jgi:hypothetical protein